MRMVRHRRLLGRTSYLAMSAAFAIGMAGSAHGQAFQGSGNVTHGSAEIATGAGTTEVTVQSLQAVIDWRPDDTGSGPNAIDFLPAGTRATFINGPNQSDFAVLNRIIPSDVTRGVQFNGAVISQLQQAAGQSAPGGTVFFFSPGGIVISPTATFDVGKLGLTTSDPVISANGAFISNDTVVFQQASQPGSAIRIAAGASISAPANRSYVALVAPVIEQGGSIAVNGSAALVAADAATITFSPDGLFDIEVGSGSSSSGTVLSHSGSTGGGAGDGIADSHRVYMVAIAKNDAITMALTEGSTLGFDVAAAADTDGNAIVLSAGYDIAGGQIARADGQADSGPANIDIGGAQFSSAVNAQASQEVSVHADQADIAFASDVTIRAVDRIGMAASEGHSLDIAGATVLETIDPGDLGPVGEDKVGGEIAILADGGAINLSSTLAATASASGGFSFGSAIANDAGAGGAIALSAVSSNGNSGSVSIDGGVLLQSTGTGSRALQPNSGGGNGTGGMITVRAIGEDAQLSFGANLTASVSGLGTSCASCTRPSGDGIGGTIEIGTAGNATANVSVAGDLRLFSLGTGGEASLGAGGRGHGGHISLGGDDGGLAIRGNANFNADGSGGGSVEGAGGAGIGGSAELFSTGSLIAVAGALDVTATGVGGSGNANAPGGIGGAGSGGTLLVGAGAGRSTSFSAAADGGSGQVSIGDGVTSALDGFAGSGFVGGFGQGGQAYFSAQGGSLVINGQSAINAEGYGGDGSSNGGGDGNGGEVLVLSSGPLNSPASTVTVAGIDVRANGFGGFGLSSVADGPGADGGDGAGGKIAVLGEAGNGALAMTGPVRLQVTGEGGRGASAAGSGSGGSGGNAAGGSIVLGLIARDSSPWLASQIDIAQASFRQVIASNSAIGGAGGSGMTGGRGGDAASGGWTILAQGGTASFGTADLTNAAIAGTGGGGAVVGRGGDATIGLAGTVPTANLGLVDETASGMQILVTDRDATSTGSVRGTLNAQSLTAHSVATAGTGSDNGLSRTGGANNLSMRNGDFTFGAVDISVTADTLVAGSQVENISLTGSSAMGDSFTYRTIGALTLTLDNSAFTAGTIDIAAANWVLGDVPGVAGTLSAAGLLSLSTDGDLLTTANIASGSDFALAIAGDIVLGDVSSDGAVILSSAAGSVSAANVNSAGRVSLYADDALAAGAITGADIIALAGSGIATGDLNAGAGRILLADKSMALLGGLPESFDPEPLFAAQPARLDGPLTTGNVMAGQFTAATRLDFAANSIAASDLLSISAGGLVAVNGNWTSSRIRIVSADIALSATGRLQSGGDIFLETETPGLIEIGNGLTGSGYAISSDEFSRIAAQRLTIAGQDIRLGTLTIGAGASSTSFVTRDAASGLAGGTIRIVGAVTGTGFADTSVLRFETGTFSLDAATGSLAVTNGAGALGGIVSIGARDIRFADTPVLARLAADPLYAGRIADLNTPTATRNLSGILQARSLALSPTRTLHIQNSGTLSDQSGFRTTLAPNFIQVPQGQAGGVDIVINGRFARGNQTLTSAAAFDGYVQSGGSVQGFTETSQLNGCLFSAGLCGSVLQITPERSIVSTIDVLAVDPLPEEPIAEDIVEESEIELEDIEAQQEEQAIEDEIASSPIVPPVSIISTKSLDPSLTIREPVAGSGNPALTGSPCADEAEAGSESGCDADREVTGQ